MCKPVDTLKSLTIKPTDLCGYGCPYCASRQALLGRRNGDHLTLSEWEVVLRAARHLGVTAIRISGGEPTMYHDLLPLVAAARQCAGSVEMYSNGRQLTPTLARGLSSAGLENVSISVLSLQAERHDVLRRTPGSLSWALSACEAATTALLRVSLHVIVCRHNYMELPDIIRHAHGLGAAAVELHYPENDAAGRYLLMDTGDIVRWREEGVTRCLSVLGELDLASEENVRALAGLYANHTAHSDHTRGIYWPSAAAAGHCARPLTFAMVYPSGDVLPCNAIEYIHEPILGNVRLQDLDVIWKSRASDDFRRNRTPWCRFCPMILHSKILLRSTGK